nr:unnamed protein product [Spirometra erinaceieuropaei]
MSWLDVWRPTQSPNQLLPIQQQQQKRDLNGEGELLLNAVRRLGYFKNRQQKEGGWLVEYDHHFFKKVPQGAEAVNILVGETDFLPHPVVAFVRLKEATNLGEMTEVPVPTRFIFMLFGTQGNGHKYEQIGRAVGTLFSDEVFHDFALRSTSKTDLLAGIDEFLSASLLLPPSQWDPKSRIDPPPTAPSEESRRQLAAPSVGTSVSARSRHQHHHSHQETDGTAGLLTTTVLPTVQSAAHGDSGSEQPSQSVDIEAARSGGSGGGAGGGAGGGNGSQTTEEAMDRNNNPALMRTGRLFGGLVADLKRRAPHYLSDFTDAIHIQCFASFFFLYFACLAPIITFGGLLSTVTGGYLGTMESIVSGAVVGILYALFSGQPLTIMGSTGPVLVFEGIIYRLCTNWSPAVFPPMDCRCIPPANISNQQNLDQARHDHPMLDLPFIGTNDTDAHHPSNNNSIIDWERITSDLYTWDALETQKRCRILKGVWNSKACEAFYAPDVFFFCCLLFLSCFLLSYALRSIRTSRFFPSRIRSLIADFGVMIAIIICTLVDYFCGLHTPKLQVPTEFEPTLGYGKRGWLIPPFNGNPWWSSLLALGPALLAVILIFMDQQITAVIINRRENKLKKGEGYHLDLLIVAITLATNSLLGIPWFVAATVLSINHVLSLKKVSESAAPGEQPVFLGCREQRVTGFLIFLFIGLSVFMSHILRGGFRTPFRIRYWRFWSWAFVVCLCAVYSGSATCVVFGFGPVLPARPGNATKCRDFLPSLKRAGTVDAVVEFVSSASRLRLHIPRENCLCTAVASGLICPRPSRRMPNMPEEAGEPFGDEAYNYTREICMQRDVKFEADSIDRVGGVIGWIHLPAEVRITPPKKGKKGGAGVFSSANLSVILVARGYATVNGSPAAQRSAHYAELLKAETFASEHNMGMWSSEEFRASRQAEMQVEDNEGVREEDTDQTGRATSAVESGLLSMADMKVALPSVTSELINSDVVKRAAASRLSSMKLAQVTTVGKAVAGNNGFRFFVQFNADAHIVHGTNEKLNSGTLALGGPESTSFAPKRGLLCAARFSVDNLWYRARVTRVAGKLVTVVFIDFGNEETIDTSIAGAPRLAGLPKALAEMRPLATEYRLAYVQMPQDSDYRDVALDQMIRLIGEQDIHISVVPGAPTACGKEDNHPVQSALVLLRRQPDTTTGAASSSSAAAAAGSELLDVSEELLREGLAYTERVKMPADLCVKYFRAQEAAMSQRVNIWRYGDFREDEEDA